MRYIKHYNKTATPIRWSYAENRMTAVQLVSTVH
jgi:hypothetical protein